MSALVVLIAASLLLAIGFLIAFIIATKKGQYEDVYTPAVRILFETPTPLSDDDLIKSSELSPQGEEKNASVGLDSKNLQNNIDLKKNNH